MFCKNCGTNVAEGIQFCTKCGARMEAPDSANFQHGNMRMSTPQQPYGYAQPTPGYQAPAYAPPVQPQYSPDVERYTPPPAPKKLSGAAIVWHIIAALLCVALLCTTLWAMYKPMDGLFVEVAGRAVDYESYRSNSEIPDSDNPIFGFVATVGAGVGVLEATDSPAGLFLAIVTVLGYLVLIAVLITLIIYLIMCMCGKNKTGVASFSSIAAFVVSLLIICGIFLCDSQADSRVRENLGYSFGQAYDEGMEDLEDRYGYGNLFEPSAALYALLGVSVLSKVALTVSKNIREKDLKE